MSGVQLEALRYAVYWHHARPLRSPGSEERLFSGAQLTALLRGHQTALENDLPEYFSKLNSVLSSYGEPEIPALEPPLSIDPFDVPAAPHRFNASLTVPASTRRQLGDQLVQASLFHLVRYCVTTADHLVSSGVARGDWAGQAYALLKHIQKQINDSLYLDSTPLTESISSLLEEPRWSASPARLKDQQVAVAKILDQRGVRVLQAPGGSGKTLVSLMSAKDKEGGLVYVAPTVSVCQSLFREMTDVYFPDGGVSVELVTGQDKRIRRRSGHTELMEASDAPELSSDIIILTIDQMLAGVVNQKGLDILTLSLTRNLVFDEFHEVMEIEGIDLIFATLVELRRHSQQLTLLMSATPAPLFCRVALNISPSHFISMASFNAQPFEVRVTDLIQDMGIDPFTESFVPQEGEKWVVISDSARQAQAGFLSDHQRDISALLAHSKISAFARSDMIQSFLEAFSDLSIPHDGAPKLRSGPFIQSSWNITSHGILTEASTAENLLQRIARTNRFGEGFVAKFFIHAPPEGRWVTGSMKRSGLEHLHIDFVLEIAEKVRDRANLTLNEFYAFYNEFYARRAADSELNSRDESALLVKLAKSSNWLAKRLQEPTDLPVLRRTTRKNKLSKHSLRGSSYYATAPLYVFENNTWVSKDEYVGDFTLEAWRFDAEILGNWRNWAKKMPKDQRPYTNSEFKLLDNVFLSLAREKSKAIRMGLTQSHRQLRGDTRLPSLVYLIVNNGESTTHVGYLKPDDVDDIL